MTPGFALFDTKIGRCGVAWGEHGLLGVQLPEANDAQTRARIQQKAPGAQETSPPPDDPVRLRRHGASAQGRDERSFLHHRRYEPPAGVQPQGLRCRAYHSTRRDPHIWRYRHAAGRQAACPLDRPSPRTKSISDCHSLPSRAGGQRQDRRLFSQWWRDHASSGCSPSRERSSPRRPTTVRCCSIRACRLLRAGSDDNIAACKPGRCFKANACP